MSEHSSQHGGRSLGREGRWSRLGYIANKINLQESRTNKTAMNTSTLPVCTYMHRWIHAHRHKQMQRLRADYHLHTLYMWERFTYLLCVLWKLIDCEGLRVIHGLKGTINPHAFHCTICLHLTSLMWGNGQKSICKKNEDAKPQKGLLWIKIQKWDNLGHPVHTVANAGMLCKVCGGSREYTIMIHGYMTGYPSCVKTDWCLLQSDFSALAKRFKSSICWLTFFECRHISFWGHILEQVCGEVMLSHSI